MPVQPIATVGSMHVCPLCTGTVPHVGGPVTGPGMPGVTINGQPVAVMGDMCTCAGPPDTIAQGCPGVTINGKPVAMVGSMTAHGGQITVGVPGVTIESPGAPVTMAVKKIPFPDLNFLDDLGAALVGKGKSHQQGKENMEKLKEEKDEGEPCIYNVRWIDEAGNTIDNTKIEGKIFIAASVYNINEGDKVTFKLRLDTEEGDEIETLEGTVQNKEVKIEWCAEKRYFKEFNH
ncbi:MAG: PAAR domain-containing protein [Marinilabiliaceae bacterium]|nr:PAAR domain-containing protein [Marinilabiliaceae bacterium]